MHNVINNNVSIIHDDDSDAFFQNKHLSTRFALRKDLIERMSKVISMLEERLNKIKDAYNSSS